MTKGEISAFIDTISPTGPGGVIKIKKVLRELLKQKKEGEVVTVEELEEALLEKQDTLVSGENVKTVGGQSIVGKGNIEVGDKDAIKFVLQQLTEAQKAQARANIDAYKKPSTGIPASDIANGVIPDISGKQDTITDLQEIRSGAAAGATAVQPSALNSKQDVISDLPVIRSGAALGSTSVQPAEFNELKDEVDTIGNGAYEEAWDGDSTPVVADIPAGVVVTYGSASYTGTLAASASTVDKIYLVSDGNGNYDRYTTVEANGAYSWKKVGSTAIPLSNYATRTQVSQLQQEVNSLPRGKNYGFFTTSADLPADATEEGFAYVGATEPYAIWTFDGDNWTDSGVSANAFNANEEQVKDSVDEYLEEHPAIMGTFPNAAKRLLVSLLEKVAYIDGNGQQYINQLNAALNDVAIDHITAVFTQPEGATGKIYDLDSLDRLRDFLSVTAYFVDGTHGEIFDYELSGTLVHGTSTITVTVGELSATFDVIVTGTLKLYYNGDECTSVTGGWQTKGFNLTNGTPSKTKEASDLLIRFGTSVQSGGAAGSWSTINKINLTGYTKLVCEFEAFNASGTGNLWGYWPNVLAEATTQNSAYGSDYASNRTVIRAMGKGDGSSTYPSPAETFTRVVALGTSRTSAYLSLNLNLFSDTSTSPTTYYSAGAYAKIKRVFLATD